MSSEDIPSYRLADQPYSLVLVDSPFKLSQVYSVLCVKHRPFFCFFFAFTSWLIASHIENLSPCV